MQDRVPISGGFGACAVLSRHNQRDIIDDPFDHTLHQRLITPCSVRCPSFCRQFQRTPRIPLAGSGRGEKPRSDTRPDSRIRIQDLLSAPNGSRPGLARHIGVHPNQQTVEALEKGNLFPKQLLQCVDRDR